MSAKILFIGGSLNQTTQMHQIAREIPEHDAWFSTYYCDGALDMLRRMGLMENTISGKRWSKRSLDYIKANNLNFDYGGRLHKYDLVFTCSDLIVPKNIRDKKIILVQEGMTDPENFIYHVCKTFRFLPRWLASTSMMGLSGAYDVFCVASEGYRDLFIRKGAQPEKLVVTGIPNFDNCAKYLNNDFPHRDYVLVCTSDMRETFKYDNRKKFIRRIVEIAGGRQIIFKLHPNEKKERAIAEIERYAPGALVYTDGNAEQMVANCEALVTQYSSTTFVGLALGKEVYSYQDIGELRRLLPVQNGCAAANVAQVARGLLRPKAAKKRTRNLAFAQ